MGRGKYDSGRARDSDLVAMVDDVACRSHEDVVAVHEEGLELLKAGR